MKKFLFITLLAAMITVPVVQAEAQDVYTVQSGDSLYEISEKVDVPVEIIIDQNDISSPTNIYIGQRLVVTINFNYEDSSDSYTYHTIKTGEGLWSIAQEYDVTVEELIELNEIENSSELYVGEEILIPVNDNTENEEEEVEQEDESTEVVPQYFVHTVQEDEEINDIANTFGVSVSEILDTNDISDSEGIEEGIELVIPLDNSNKLAYLRRMNQKLDNYYQATQNETLTEIAEKFEITEDILRRINQLEEDEDVIAGQKILMPVNPAFFAEHKIYEVAEGGEYIFDLSYENSITNRSILEANYLEDANEKLAEGTTIIIPLDEDSKTRWVTTDYN
ncbi:LysM peptidoglycan-binding domain-containing protein [Natroniella sulfidigena]|uniref:LysM peptidoglycan-binding domain-containing protein n=1 Tax=Natroniella sulfidigena TaxID=723921 RepID=UPI00200AB0E5|nr:LysM peptidoglycan-binding domain-containing protein [Natroniella sulfidigena]MCK8817574.1 LysM peptidoglycan-binding domain-containing protein [Natroniella sulfidigena]